MKEFKEYFDYEEAYKYGEEIGDVEFVTRAEAFTLQTITNEFPAAIKAVKQVRANSDKNRFEYVMTTYGGDILIGIRQYGALTEALVNPANGMTEYYYDDENENADYDTMPDETVYEIPSEAIIEYTGTY